MDIALAAAGPLLVMAGLVGAMYGGYLLFAANGDPTALKRKMALGFGGVASFAAGLSILAYLRYLH